jgi:hypothetical protein
MRWTRSQSGDRKTIKKFLWLPVSVGYKVRWLERVSVTYQYVNAPDYKYWNAISFNDEDV